MCRDQLSNVAWTESLQVSDFAVNSLNYALIRETIEIVAAISDNIKKDIKTDEQTNGNETLFVFHSVAPLHFTNEDRFLFILLPKAH